MYEGSLVASTILKSVMQPQWIMNNLKNTITQPVYKVASSFYQFQQTCKSFGNAQETATTKNLVPAYGSFSQSSYMSHRRNKRLKFWAAPELAATKDLRLCLPPHLSAPPGNGDPCAADLFPSDASTHPAFIFLLANS
jgi:hypothetical protein